MQPLNVTKKGKTGKQGKHNEKRGKLGEGTGKTRDLTTRVAHIVETNLAFPSQVLCVTFTNKAAREMAD